MSPTRRLLGTPNAFSSACVPGSSAPGPIPKMTRPSARRSSVATACAIEMGCRSSGKRTAVPSATFFVAPARAASRVNGSPRGRASSESPTQTESYPEASARRAASMTNERSLSLHRSTSREGRRRPVPGACFAVLFRLYIIAGSSVRGPLDRVSARRRKLETSPGAQVPPRMQIVAGRHARRLRRRSSGFTSWVTWGSFHSRNAGERSPAHQTRPAPASGRSLPAASVGGPRRARPLTTLKRPQNVGISSFYRAASGPHNCLVDVLTKGVGI